MSATTYHEGGFLPEAPANNLAERWDAEAGTFTAWDVEGAQTEQRPLTEDEVASLRAPDALPAATVLPQERAQGLLDQVKAASTVAQVRAALVATLVELGAKP